MPPCNFRAEQGNEGSNLHKSTAFGACLTLAACSRHSGTSPLTTEVSLCAPQKQMLQQGKEDMRAKQHQDEREQGPVGRSLAAHLCLVVKERACMDGQAEPVPEGRERLTSRLLASLMRLGLDLEKGRVTGRGGVLGLQERKGPLLSK